MLEVGAGHGTFTEMLSARGYHVVATDVSERCAGILRDRFATDERVTVVPGGAEAVAGMPLHDAAVLINVPGQAAAKRAIAATELSGWECCDAVIPAGRNRIRTACPRFSGVATGSVGRDVVQAA
jgi:Methyltransferase domain